MREPRCPAGRAASTHGRCVRLCRPDPLRAGLFAAALAIAGGCADEANLEFFPARAGMRWEYDVSVLTQTGTGNRRLFVESLGEERRAGRRFAARRNGDGTVSYYEERRDGLWRLDASAGGDEAVQDAGDAVDPLGHGEKLLGYPLRPGTTWRATEQTVTLEKHTPPHGNLTRVELALDLDYRIDAVDEAVVVPAGRFEHCVRVHAEGEASREVGLYIGAMDIRVEVTRWYAPGVGLVKAERRESTSEPTLPYGEYTLVLRKLQR